MDFKLKETQSGTVSKESTEYIKRYHVHSHSLMQRSVAFAFHLEEHQVAINNIQFQYGYGLCKRIHSHRESLPGRYDQTDHTDADGLDQSGF